MAPKLIDITNECHRRCQLGVQDCWQFVARRARISMRHRCAPQVWRAIRARSTGMTVLTRRCRQPLVALARSESGLARCDVALRWRTRRVGVATSVHDSILARSSTRFKPLMR